MRYGVPGPIEVRDGDRQVPIGGRQQQRLLGMLLAEPGQVVGTDRLIDAMWPDGHPPDAAAHTILTLSGEVTVYDTRDVAHPEPLRTLAGSNGYILDAQFDASGRTFVTLGGDRDVTIYDAPSGVTLGTQIPVADDDATVIALRPDGKELAIGGSPTLGMQIWDLDPAHWADAACRLAGRNLTGEEWRTNVGSLAGYRATCP